MNTGFSASSKFRNSQSLSNNNYATTPGSFFHARHQRNNSLSQRTDGQVLGSPTYQTSFMANVAQSVPITSKTFRNYLSTRDRKLEHDKQKIEKLNEAAFKRVKNEKLAEKEEKNRKIVTEHKIGKIQERVVLNRKAYEANVADVQRESNNAFKTHLKSVEERVQKKHKDEIEKSRVEFMKTLNGDVEFRSRLSAGNVMDGKSGLASKT